MWNSELLAQYCEAEHRGATVDVLRVNTDSRAVKSGDLFVALSGERFDGHVFVNQAIKAGALAVLVSVDVQVPAHVAVLVVKDTLLALQQIAHADRLQFQGPLVAVTGSNGKTTTKELVAAVLREHYGSDAVLATKGNLNNHIGVPLTLLSREAKHQALVVEMGMNHFGELSLLSEIAQPTVALITNAGPAHLEGVGNVAGVAKAKGEIFNYMREAGTAVINGDDYFSPYWEVLNKDRHCVKYGLSANATVRGRTASGHLTVITNVGETLKVLLPFKGVHNALNALAAIATAQVLGIDSQTIKRGIENATNVGGRLDTRRIAEGINLIDDSYNANPASVLAAVNVLAEEQGQRVLVLGDIGELGEQTEALHEQVLQHAVASAVDQVLTLGDNMRKAAKKISSHKLHPFDAMDDLVDALLKLVTAHGEGTVSVLVKGSRFMAMERVIVSFEEAVASRGMR